MNRAYILGAGFSSCAGLPLINHLSEVLINEVETTKAITEGQRKHDLEVFLKSMKQVYPAASLSSRDFPNIEYFFDMLDANEYLFSKFNPQKSNDKLKKLKILLTVWLCKIIQSHNSKLDPIRKFIRQLRPGDTVLTFNWDVLFEQVFTEEKSVDELNYCPLNFERERSSEKINFLKLHGSISWLDDQEWRPADSAKDEWEVLGNRIWRTKQHVSFVSHTIQVPALIIPPQSRKIYEKYPDLIDLWDFSLKALSKSEEIFIIGFAASPIDIHARSLILNGITHNSHLDRLKVTVVNPDQSVSYDIKHSIIDHVGCKFEYFLKKFENYV